MASATGIPENVNEVRGVSETEPLLGQRGDASQAEGQNIFMNWWIGTLSSIHLHMALKHILIPCQGTAPIAQAGIWIVSLLPLYENLHPNLLCTPLTPTVARSHGMGRHLLPRPHLLLRTPSTYTLHPNLSTTSLTPSAAPQHRRPPPRHPSSPNPPTDPHPLPKTHRHPHPRHPTPPRPLRPPYRPHNNRDKQARSRPLTLHLPARHPGSHFLHNPVPAGVCRFYAVLHAGDVWRRGKCEEGV